MSRDLPPHLYPSHPLASSSSSSPSPLHSVPHPHIIPDQGSSSPIDIIDMMPDEDEAGDEENIFRDMTFDEILEDLNARFLVNLPREEMSLVRVYWQAEQAHWFYEDYLRPLNPLLPSLSQRQFTHLIIASSPLYSHLGSDDYDAVWEEYCRYKRMVPCCGGILVNQEGDKCLMVRGWKSNAGWCFPRGKINSEEAEVACAIREVEEETGFNLTGLINPEDRIQTQISAQVVTMFIVGGIDENTVFETQTRKEIGAIEWVPFVDLPTWQGKRGPKTTTQKGKKKFYNVTPFVGPLKRWLTDNGYAVHPKRRPVAQPPQQPALRSLEPYNFDESPIASPQIHFGRPTQHVSHDHTALDNLFHRFIHKQEQDIDAPANDNKAGLARLFGNLNVLKKEDEALYHTEEREKQEDDALARLLGGLSTATPAPRSGHMDQPKSEKANKLLAMLNVPSPPLPNHAPIVKPHQASLLAVLSPQARSGVAHPSTAASRNLPRESQKTISLPTSPRPPSPTQEERSRKQRALLEQITAGFGLDVPALPPVPSSQEATRYEYTSPSLIDTVSSRPQVSRSPSNTFNSSASPPSLPHAHASRPPQVYSAQRLTPPDHPSPSAVRNPPPPYEPPQPTYSHPFPGHHPHPQPLPHPNQQPNTQYMGLPPNIPLTADQHRALLAVLQHQSPPGTSPGQVRPGQGPGIGAQSGYRPISQPFSGATNGGFNSLHPLPPMPSAGGFGPAYPGPGNGQYGLPSHPSSFVRPHTSIPAPGQFQPPGPGLGPHQPLSQFGGPSVPQPPFPQGQHTLHGQHNYPAQPPPNFHNQYPMPPHPQMGSQQPQPPQLQQVQPNLRRGSHGSQTTGYHHPVPRPPTGNAGTLLGMLNDGGR